jgi:hypothetical protein
MIGIGYKNSVSVEVHLDSLIIYTEMPKTSWKHVLVIFGLPILLYKYIPLFSTYTDKHNIALLLDFIAALRHVSVTQGDHHQGRTHNYKGKQVLRQRPSLLQ